MSDPLLYSVEDGLARLTLNRPERLNAFDDALAYAWADATADATARPDVKAIVVDAAGPAFCAGGDVLAMASGIGSARALEELAHVISRGILSLTESSVPVVAAAHARRRGGLVCGCGGHGSRVGRRADAAAITLCGWFPPTASWRSSSRRPSSSWCLAPGCCSSSDARSRSVASAAS
ncbi:enoyl-CoA hydratase/isomerase family protein [Ralstonia pickettii]|uniref:enoyl-CoA hydratase/isomerase family protein n=1 Tax=Ralstonia pickettii TaxID=329 RepID=UPI001C66C86B